MTDSRSPIIDAILERYRQLCADHDRAQESIDRVQIHQRGLMNQINDCFAAARLFSFDLVAEFQREAKGDPRQPTLPDTLNISPVPAAAVARAGPSVKEMVLSALKAAHPNPIRASEIRQSLATRGVAIHEKTVGMTLYRFSEKGLAKRDGWDWYYVSQMNGESTEEQVSGPSPLFH